MTSPGLVGVDNNCCRAEGGKIRFKCSLGFFLGVLLFSSSEEEDDDGVTLELSLLSLSWSAKDSDRLTQPISPPSSLVSAQLLKMEAICSKFISAEVNFSRL